MKAVHSVHDQVIQLEKERAEIELQLKRLKHELHTAQLELNKTANQYKDAQNQIQMLSKERGVCVCVCVLKDQLVFHYKSVSEI